MTEPTVDPADEGQADEDLDTTDGERDPLTTDDGLVAASRAIPLMPDDDARAEDGSEPADPSVQPEPTHDQAGLDVGDDGFDPTGDYAVEEA